MDLCLLPRIGTGGFKSNNALFFTLRFPTTAFIHLMDTLFSKRTFALLALVIGIGLATPTHAQRTSGSVGVGAQLGDPSGVTLKIYNQGAPSYDFLGAWSGVNEFFFLNAHALFENSISADNLDQPLEWYVGPGAFIGTFEGGGPFSGEAVIGVSGTIGLQMVLADHFELYLQATPRFAVIPGTEGDIGGGLGLRYYF